MRSRAEHRPHHRGVALLTVLVVIALLTLLILSFLSITQSEHRESSGFAESQKAKMAAQSSLAHAIGTLRENIPDPAPIDTNAATASIKNWAINPGRLTLIDSDGSLEHIPLHSGAAENSPSATRDPNVHSFDLNEPIPGTEAPAISYAFDTKGNPDTNSDFPPMRVKWVNLLSDPSKEATKSNPIISRHAFWIDDESGKLNYNTAVGKPSREDDDTEFYKQYELGMMPPLFRPGNGSGNVGTIESNRKWGLGSPRSVNLEVLFDSPSDIDLRSLVENNYYRGFSRHPEGILEHLTLSDKKKSDWLQGNRYQLTFFSKSPEFNAFGKPRLMLSNIPLSLEGGPNYQLPFVYNGPGAPDTLQEMKGVLHLSALLGSMGFTGDIYDGQKLGKVDAGNIVNRAQLEMLLRYFRREFPGYDASFVDKYGEEECAQMALGMLLMARIATTTMRENVSELPKHIKNNPRANLSAELLKGFSADYALRTTSVAYSPHDKERQHHNPERHYWRFQPGSGNDPGHFLAREEDSDDFTIPMIPQTPGPHITEVRLVFRSFPAREKPKPLPELQVYKDYPIARGKVIPGKKWLGFRFEVEYYAHPLAPKVRLNNFPYRTDYLRLDLSGGSSFVQELGPPNPESASKRADRNWTYNKYRRDGKYDREGNLLYNKNGRRRSRRITDRKSLGSLTANPRVVIYPEERLLKKPVQRNRILVNGPWQLIGKERRWLGNITDRKASNNDLPKMFDAVSTIEVDVKFRGGLSVSPGGGRPRQMIPMGEEVTDVLEGKTSIQMNSSETPSLSWQIEDPRLSSHRDQWWYEEQPDSTAGTPGEPNQNANKADQFEPDHDSPEKSKFRYFQRGFGRVAGLDRRRSRRITDRKSLGSLTANPRVVIYPEERLLKKPVQRNRILVNGPWQLIGKERRWLGNITDRKASNNDLPKMFDAVSTIEVDVKFRGGLSVSPGGGRPRQMIPMGEEVTDVLEGKTSIQMNSSETPSLSWQIEDPRLSSHRDQWWYEEQPDSTAGTPGEPNQNANKADQFEPDHDSPEKSKFRYFQRGFGRVAGLDVRRFDEYDSRSRISSKGYWSMLHTGIQNQKPWRTLSLSAQEDGEPGPPDWLLMDLLGNSFPMQRGQWKKNSTLPDEFSTISYMHATTGAINLNTKPYPDGTPYFSAPQRREPLKGVFKHLRSDGAIDDLLDSIESYQTDNHFSYVGELSELDGYLKDTEEKSEFKNEDLLRNMIGCLTTKSNTFGVWGVGQTVRKTRGNTKWDQFEDGDRVDGERRYFAIVERYIWPGIDGVPGNAHLSSSGHWDRTASPKADIPIDGSQTDRLFQLPGSPPLRKQGNSNRLVLNHNGTYPEFDGPQEVEMDIYASKALGKVVWKESPLEEAYNPPQPVIKYRVIYFRHLDE